MKTTYTFREITTASELEQWMRLRYVLFTNSRNKVFLRQNQHHVDIDHFDLHARHFGLWQGDHKIGYVRVVHPKSELKCRAAVGIMADYPVAEVMPSGLSVAPFPFLSYPNVPKSYWHFYETAISRGEQFMEGSRLILQPEFRGLRITQHLLTCALSIYLDECLSALNLIVSCQATQQSFYATYGFTPIAGVAQFLTHGLPKVSLVMRGGSALPAHLHDDFCALASEFRSNQSIERAL